MIMSPRLRKFTLLLHVTTSVGLLGAVAAFLVLAVTGLASPDESLVRAAYPAADLIARLIVVPLAVAALVIGVVESLGTRWGLIRHYWLIAKLVLTVIALLVLLLQLPTIHGVASAAMARPLLPGDLSEARLALVLHASGGLAVLLLPLGLSMYKPRGRTRFGRRRA
jgi:hypothetical protein